MPQQTQTVADYRVPSHLLPQKDEAHSCLGTLGLAAKLITSLQATPPVCLSASFPLEMLQTPLPVHAPSSIFPAPRSQKPLCRHRVLNRVGSQATTAKATAVPGTSAPLFFSMPGGRHALSSRLRFCWVETESPTLPVHSFSLACVSFHPFLPPPCLLRRPTHVFF